MSKEETALSQPMQVMTEAANEYRQRHDDLFERLSALDQQIEQLKRRRAKGLRSAAVKLAQSQKRLKTLVAANPGEFKKPKTMTVARVKFGYQKQKGRTVWPSDSALCASIRRLFPDQVETLIKTTEKPVSKAVSNLPAADIKRLGATVEDSGDKVIIKLMDSEIDKLIERLIQSEEALEAVA